MQYFILCLIPFLVLAKGAIHSGHQLGIGVASPVLLWPLVESMPVKLFLIYIFAWGLFVRILYLANRIDVHAAMGATDVSFMVTLVLAVYVVSVRIGTLEGWSNAICIVAICQTLLAVCQINGVDPFLWLLRAVHGDVRLLLNVRTPTGSLGNNNFLAGFLVISSPFFFRRLWAWFLAPMAAIVLLSHTTGAVMAFVAGFYLVVILGDEWVTKTGKWVLAAIGIWIITGYILLIDPNGIAQFSFDRLGRFDIWSIAAKSIISHGPIIFLIGHGPGAPLPYGSHLHNDLLEMFYLFGFVGFAVAAWFVIDTYRRIKNHTVKFSFIISILFSLVSLPMFLIPTAVLMTTIFGLCERKHDGELSYVC